MPSPTEISPATIQAYILGTLDDSTTVEIKRAAEQDPELAAEIAIWKAVRELQAQAAEDANPGEFVWERIESTISARGQTTVANDNASKEPRPMWLRQVIAPWQAAAAVAAGVLGWQVAVVPAITTASIEDEPAYELASGSQAEEFTLRVSFTESATEVDIREALRGADARIVDGPSAIGLYTIAFPDAAAKEAAADALSAQTDTLAEVAE